MSTDLKKPITVNIKFKRQLSLDHPLYEPIAALQAASPGFGLSDLVATLAFDNELGIEYLSKFLSHMQSFLANPDTVPAASAPVKTSVATPPPVAASPPAQATAPSPSAAQPSAPSREAALNALSVKVAPNHQ